MKSSLKSPILQALLLLLIFPLGHLNGQHADSNVFGDVQCEGAHVPFATIYIEGTTIGTTTDITGHYMLIDLPAGNHVIVDTSMGYSTVRKEISIREDEVLEVNFVLETETMALDEIVVTGTRTFKKQTNAPVIVNVIDSKLLNQPQSCYISEGLRFQPGLRVETDCQTSNYTQLRMNGLGGSYSQILINGRPIFSPLTGLYEMEQIPANMVSGNINMLTHKRNGGASIFVNRRMRGAYDHNGENYSELPELANNSFGANLFYKPTPDQKLEISLSRLSEYRYGGELINDAAHFAEQAEERTHNVLMGSADYQLNFNQGNSALIAYLAGQQLYLWARGSPYPLHRLAPEGFINSPLSLHIIRLMLPLQALKM